MPENTKEKKKEPETKQTIPISRYELENCRIRSLRYV